MVPVGAGDENVAKSVYGSMEADFMRWKQTCWADLCDLVLGTKGAMYVITTFAACYLTCVLFRGRKIVVTRPHSLVTLGLWCS